MMMINVFTDSDCIELEVSVLVLSVSPIVGGGVAVLAYAILARGTYIISIV
jgi:hypothetical protein